VLPTERVGPEPLGDRVGAAIRHFAFRLGARGDHDSGRRRPERVEVRLVVRVLIRFWARAARSGSAYST
jgi:hypothetical protein